jgi:hypothetical protein
VRIGRITDSLTQARAALDKAADELGQAIAENEAMWDITVKNCDRQECANHLTDEYGTMMDCAGNSSTCPLVQEAIAARKKGHPHR